MVYTKVLSVRGVLCSYAEDLKYFSSENYSNDSDMIYEYQEKIRKNLKKYGLEIVTYQCCSELQEKYFIVGKVIQTCLRAKNKNCKEAGCDAENYNPCNVCIGRLVNGKVCDPEKILNTVTINKDLLESCEDDFILGVLKSIGIDRELKTYDMLDDCLSCT